MGSITSKIAAAWSLAILTVIQTGLIHAEEPLSIGSRRELFVDEALIDSLSNDAQQVLHHPKAQNVALTHVVPRYRRSYENSQINVFGNLHHLDFIVC